MTITCCAAGFCPAGLEIRSFASTWLTPRPTKSSLGAAIPIPPAPPVGSAALRDNGPAFRDARVDPTHGHVPWPSPGRSSTRAPKEGGKNELTPILHKERAKNELLSNNGSPCSDVHDGSRYFMVSGCRAAA